MVTDFIKWALSNFGLFMLMIALIAMSVHRMTNNKAAFYESLYRWVALLPVGFNAIYAFIMHAFFPSISAATIGWQDSPFQFEVAIANLAIGVIAILSVSKNQGFRLATVIASTCWFWGDGIGHIYQMLRYNNFAPGNAGSWFYLDMILPMLLMLCMVKINKKTRQ
jgi:hypothetical protein